MADDEFYTQLAADADEILEEFGRSAQLAWNESASGPAWEQTATPHTENVIIVEYEYSTRERDGQRIQANDKRFLMGAAVPPPAHARLLDDGASYAIVNAERVKPGNITVIYLVQARA